MPYMIQDTSSLLWSTGGQYPKFGAFSRAKVWRTLGQVSSHLAFFRTFNGVNQVPQTWRVFPVELQISGVGYVAHELVQPNCDKQAKKRAGYKDRYAKEEADREKAELLRLKKKYDGPAHAPGHE